MHMPDVLVAAPAVFGATLVTGGLALAVSARRVARSFPEERLPLLGVLGAFIFAGQMVNFSLPGLYTSGHLVGAALLTTLFGPAAAILVMSAVLIVQCLLFQDGGLLALGANLLNMGVIPALVTAASLAVARRGVGGRLGRLLGAGVGAWLGTLVGAAAVPLMAAASGALPAGVSVRTFLAVMLGLHALIGLGEAVITIATLAFLGRVRPDVLVSTGAPARAGRALVGLIVVGLAISLAIGGGLSHLASSDEDGLEHAMAAVGVVAEGGDVGAERVAAELVDHTALLADYDRFPGLGDGPIAMTLAGMAGTLIVFGLLFLVAVVFARRNAHASPRAS